MIEKSIQPRLLNMDMIPKIEDSQSIDLTATPDFKYHAAVARLMMEAGLNGTTLTVEEAKKEVDLMYGRTVLESLDDSIFVDPNTEAKDSTKAINESLREAFISKGSKLGQPAEFIEEIFEIHRLMGTIGQTPDQEEKIKIADQFKRYVGLTISIHDMNRSLKNNRRVESKTPKEIEAVKAPIIQRIRKAEAQRLDTYLTLFSVNKLIKAGIIEDKAEAKRFLSDESLTLIRLLRYEGFPDVLDKVKKNRYMHLIEQYKVSLGQEE